jgi:hypothetical protein
MKPSLIVLHGEASSCLTVAFGIALPELSIPVPANVPRKVREFRGDGQLDKTATDFFFSATAIQSHRINLPPWAETFFCRSSTGVLAKLIFCF